MEPVFPARGRGGLFIGSRDRRQPSLHNSSPVVPQQVGGIGATDIQGQVIDLVQHKEVVSGMAPEGELRPEPIVRAQHDGLATQTDASQADVPETS